MTTLVADPKVQRAVSSIPQRSEREQDLEKLARSFVDTGVITQLHNKNNQILFGRRGTGKSHVLKVLSERLQSKESLPLYIDLRTLGSNTRSGEERTASHVGVLIFKDILSCIHDALVERALAGNTDVTNEGWAALDALADTITKVAKLRVDESIVERSKTVAASSDSAGVGAEASTKEGIKAHAEFGGSDRHDTESEVTRTYRLLSAHHVVFGEVHRALEAAAHGQGLDHVYVLVDEWTTIDSTAQANVADLIKRAILPSACYTVKIAALEYRANFSVDVGRNNVLGFELGADISANIDLDDSYVLDRNPTAITSVFEDLLYKHLLIELPDNYLHEHYSISEPGALTSTLFTARDTLRELVRAAEGVARDFINIFSHAYFNSFRRGRDKIDMQSILESARHWYEQDKASQLTPTQEQFVRNVLNQVIGAKKSRSFMVERKDARHPTIHGLFDYRVLHLMLKGYSDKANPGVRYNIYSLDYGLYVDLRRTSQCPELDLPDVDKVEDVSDRIVPFDDKRSIRRIVLTSEQLERWSRETVSEER